MRRSFVIRSITAYLFCISSLLSVGLVLSHIGEVPHTLEKRDICRVGVLRIPIGMVITVEREVNRVYVSTEMLSEIFMETYQKHLT